MSGLGWHHLTRNDKLAILAGLENGSARGGPYHVELHSTNRCNINCFFCATQKIRQADEIPLSRLDRLIREMKQLGTRSVGHGKGCFMRNFYYWTDGPFVRRLGGRLSGLRASALNPATA